MISWCDNCNVPIVYAYECGLCGSSTRELKLGKSELKPVFEYEKNLYREILYKSYGNRVSEIIPNGTCFRDWRGGVIIDGQKVFKVTFNTKRRTWQVKFYKRFSRNPHELVFHGSDLHKVIKANEGVLEEKERECISFLKQTVNKFDHLPLAVSFSGGKDSVVALALTRQVKPNVDVIFLNTSIEFEETVKYVHDLTKRWDLNLIETKPPHDFFELCEKLGPPSYFARWCCKTQKFAPLNKLINERYSEGVLAVSGLRPMESSIRKDFERVRINEMIPKQILVFVIYHWSSLDVWLYLLLRKIPFNQLYRFGFPRLGCWSCPVQSSWSFELTKLIRPDLMNRLFVFLTRHAKENHLDVETWVNGGKWRRRRPKYKLATACTSQSLCTGEVLYVVRNADFIDRVKEFMRVFGTNDTTKFMTRIHGLDIDISIIGNQLRVSAKNDKVLSIFEKQLLRALNCVGCGECVGSCDYGALQLRDGEIKISNEKCNHCLQCVTKIRCVSLHYNKRRTISIGYKQNNRPLQIATVKNRRHGLDVYIPKISLVQKIPVNGM